MPKQILTKTALLSLIILSVQPILVSAAINIGGNSYEFDHTSSTKNILETVPDVRLNSSTIISGSDLGGLAASATQAAVSSTGWLKNTAGIDVIGILKTMGRMFVQVAEWMIGLIKQGLGKL